MPNGTLSAFKLIEPSGRGVNADRLHSWDISLSPGGIQLHAVWTDDPPAETGWIVLLAPIEDTRDVYRIQVLRAPDNGGEDLQWETGLKQPRDGTLQASTSWGPFMGLLAAAPDPRIVLRSADGTVLRSDPIDLPGFASAVALGDSLEPELDALVADYRNRCQLIESLDPPVVDAP